ncbi:MAG: cell division protein FtsZ [Minisyncoccia bacterium]|jgi:cell division protein FtsZ
MASSNKKKEKFQPLATNVKVIGIGGGGGNAVARMARDFVRGVDFVAINTDHQDLDHCNVKHRLYIGKGLTKGLGTGMNPDLGRQAAEENRSEIGEIVKGADLVFLAAGFGGGTGTGATPVVAEAAKQAGALTIAVVTKPFTFEGSQRERIAAEGLMKLRDKVDALIVVPNDRIFTVISKDTPIIKAFEVIDDILRKALKGIVEIIAIPGIINVDFADVKNIMQDAGVTIIGVGVASGQDRAVAAVNQALHSPLLETSPEGAKAVLLGISGGRDLKMTEINEAAKIIAQTADPGARIIFGAYHDRNLKQGQVKITVIAAGFNGGSTTTLFGGSHYERQPGMFGGGMSGGGGARSGTGSPALESLSMKKPQAGKEAAAARSERERERSSDNEIFSSIDAPAKASAPAESKSSKEKKEKESDAWDIPAFLRRRKK